MKNIKLAILLATTLFTSSNYASEVIQTGRYTTIKNIPPIEQLHPLRVTVKLTVPQSIKTVEGAVRYLLMRSGYSLVDSISMSNATKSLMRLPLPQVHRNLGPITLDVALQAIAGSPFELIVDPVHRKISYDLTTSLERVIR